MKKIKNKLLMASVSALSFMPLIANCSPTNAPITLNNSSNETCKPKNENDKGHCTVTYIGKNCTSNGCAIIARATDCSPKAVHLKLKHFKENELAGKTLVGKYGLNYKMPDHTYAYTSCPLSAKTSDDPKWANDNWENNGINSEGVCTSSTLTCYTNPKVLALENENFDEKGVGEELLTTIITPQASSAKHAMQIAAKAIDDFGAQDANIIIASDQNEAWMMEIYSRHQYCAVKLPDDKVFVAGNEFILNSLDELGINESSKDSMCILSAKLHDLVKDKDFVKYTDDTKKDVYHLDLFKTYAHEFVTDGSKDDTDWAHTRTWRGYTLFDKSTMLHYSSTTKYAPFLTPKDKDGNIRKDMTAADVMDVYRDEYDDSIDSSSPRYDETIASFKKLRDEGKDTSGKWRPIAVESTRQVHIMSSDPTKPKWAAANEWYCPSSGNYAPFLQINNAMTSIDGEFGYFPDRFEFDEKCSSVLFREINKLAWYDRKNYGFPLQNFWRNFESLYCKQMDQVTTDAIKLNNKGKAEQIITNFNKHVRDAYISQVKKTKNDLMWHIMDQPSAQKTFVPLVDLEAYAKEMGWTNYKFDGSKVTFERNLIKCSYALSSGSIYGKGTLSLSNGAVVSLKDSVENNKVYVAFDDLNNVLAKYSEIRTININDYLEKFNHLIWIIPLSVVVVIGIGMATYFIIRNKKRNKLETKK